LRFDPLPSNLVLPRPMLPGTYDQALLDRLDRRGELIIQRWYPGVSLIAEFCVGRIRLYTSTMQEVDSRLDYLREELRASKLPTGTVLVGHARVPERDRDVAAMVVEGSHRDASILLGQGLLPELRVSAMPFFGTASLADLPYWNMLLRLRDRLCQGGYVRLSERWDAPLVEVKESMSRAGWKGLVLCRGSYRYRIDRGAGGSLRRRGCYIWRASR
jgi:hypothetical protein